MVHHFYWSAAFADNDIYDSIEDFISQNKLRRSLTTVVIQAELYLRDKTWPSSFLEISSPRFLLIQHLSSFLNDFYVKKIYMDQKRVFEAEFKLSDDRCVIQPFSESAERQLNSDLKVFLFWRDCNI